MSAATTPSSGTRHKTDPVISGKPLKNPKACEECRRRKQKCDGSKPCALCTKRNSQCSYRSYIRRRTGHTSTANRDTSVTSVTPGNDVVSVGVPENPVARSRIDGNDPDSEGLFRFLPPRLAIFNNIRATQHTSRGKTELFYGASSPFSVLQHLDAHLPVQGASVVYPGPDGEEVQNGDRIIRSYNYQSIVFDHLPDPVPYLNGFDGTSYASGKIALRNFLVTACPQLPFLNKRSLCDNFEKLFGRAEGSVTSTADRAIVVAALGLGAFTLTDLPCRQLFLTQARAEAMTIMYDINTEVVHATLLLAQLEFEAGSPNICYLHLGGAVRKAFAAGVHRDKRQSSKQTMWALYSFESLVCFVLGKQPSLGDGDISFPDTNDSSYMAFFVRLSAIVRAAYRIYSLDGTVMADLTAATSVHRQLGDFAKLLEKETRLRIGGQLYTLSGDDLAWQITFSYTFYVTKLLLFRPFVLSCLELKRRGIKNILSDRNSGVEMAVLVEAAEQSVISAKDLVRFCDSMFSLQIGTEGLYVHGFYLESACLVLALGAVHHSNQLSGDCFELLCTGLRLLHQLGSHEPVRSTSAAIEQIITRIRALPARLESTVAQATSHNDHVFAVTPDASARPNAPSSSRAPISTSTPINNTLTPAGWGNELLLDDMWSMMDWNIGFPSMDLDPATISGIWIASDATGSGQSAR